MVAKDRIIKTNIYNCHNTLEERLAEQDGISFKAGIREVVDMLQVATVVPTSLPNTVWFSVTHDNYKKLFPDGKLLKV